VPNNYHHLNSPNTYLHVVMCGCVHSGMKDIDRHWCVTNVQQLKQWGILRNRLILESHAC